MILAVVLLCIRGCSSTEAIMLIGKEKVTAEEFKLYLYQVQNTYEQYDDIWETEFSEGKTAFDAAKEATQKSIEYTKVSVQRAKVMNISPSEDDLLKIESNANAMYDSLSEEIRASIGATKPLLNKIYEEQFVYMLVFTEITKDYLFNEDDFDDYYRNYIEEQAIDDDSEELKLYIKEQLYIPFNKKTIFDKEYRKWLSDTKITVNADAIAKIEFIQ